jgi:hypothetical protein
MSDTTTVEEPEAEAVPVADILREQVDIRKGPADKTLITFEYAYDLGVKPKKRDYYTFIAVWIEKQGKWYVSGVGNGVPRECDNDSLMKIIAGGHVKSASVATALETFKP